MLLIQIFLLLQIFLVPTITCDVLSNIEENLNNFPLNSTKECENHSQECDTSCLKCQWIYFWSTIVGLSISTLECIFLILTQIFFFFKYANIFINIA